MAEETEIKKEFELERMILFTDAVFAIAITLLVIELKFPELHKGEDASHILSAFRPVFIRFFGFVISFIFIGLMWARHLEIFKYLQAYDNRVIARNLIFIFFVVCFPFTVSGFTENLRPGFYFPLYVYLANIVFVSTSQYALCHYLFARPNKVSIPGQSEMKKYQLLKSKYSTIVLWIALIVIVIVPIILPAAERYTTQLFFIVPLMLGVTRRRLKNYKKLHRL